MTPSRGDTVRDRIMLELCRRRRLNIGMPLYRELAEIIGHRGHGAIQREVKLLRGQRFLEPDTLRPTIAGWNRWGPLC